MFLGFYYTLYNLLSFLDVFDYVHVVNTPITMWTLRLLIVMTS